MFSLAGKKALVVGIANDQSIAWGCAKALRAQGADLAVTYLNEKAERFVRPLAEQLGAEIILPLDVQHDDQLAAVFAEITAKWGRLDTLLHSIAFCPKDDLHGRVVDCSREGFSLAMDISVHSFMRMVRLAEPLMAAGGTCMTVTFNGSQRVIDSYNVMGPVKAALESATCYLAGELGQKGITVHALSPGPLHTRAASGLPQFDKLVNAAIDTSPLRRLASIEETGALCAFLASDEARGMTGGLHFVDGGFNIV